MKTYITGPAESITGIALRELNDESRWKEIRDLNAGKYPDMASSDYYPVGATIILPESK